ncbi:haloacid dehalogenase type II [Rubrimonas cliftonensis]|uniref:(S)-2-haloacid dehalogenase n=1 Tax=Rubrimonas cliftonensis TaxID=89524 RepID=A0A1H3X1W0_9RHOB|nr:haloacid dehalogenase type II [Rubrimonas cliftonensis]SDZ92971.1 2-haloacid dehalogenase [Rubrimonas cliftonensis]
MRPQAFIFDVFGTVVDWRSGVARDVSRALPQVEPFAFAAAWRARYQPAMERVRAGGRPYVALDELHAEMLDETLAAFGARMTPPARAALATAWERLPAWPDAPDGLARLRTMAMIAPCSNGSIALMTRLARYAGLPWDCVLGADVARAYKPQPEVYLAAAAALRLAPGAVMMVAAHNDDLRAARAAGLMAGFIPRPQEHGPGQTADLSPDGPWDLVADDIADLAARVSLGVGR